MGAANDQRGSSLCAFATGLGLYFVFGRKRVTGTTMGGNRRSSYVWTPNVGWVAKKETADRDYEDYQNESWAFLISFLRWY